VVGESYLDKYGIQDAVLDGATVPVYYQGRMTEWHLEGAEVDILFDQYFANEPEDRIEEIKKRGITRGDLARFQPRIAKIALDIWSHYREHVQPDGFKAQIVAVDRPACVVYKKELDRVIAHTLVKVDGLSKDEAETKARGMSVCIYSAGQHDQQDHPELVEYQLDEKAEKEAIAAFKDPKSPLKILIVCNKLLTGFDAPVEQSMYLDSPLSDHNLLQAIARTNRRCGHAKTRGSIIDYIGVSKNLASALAAYNDDDIAGAMTDEDALYSDLQTAHREVMELLVDAPRTGNPKADAEAAVYTLQAEDSWFDFLGKANAFLVAYGALSPDPRVFEFKADLKYVGSIIPYGKLHFEASEVEVDWRQYSEKIREILDQHLEVTGLKTAVKLRSMSEPEFWADFKNAPPGGEGSAAVGSSGDGAKAEPEPKDLKTAAVRKLTELKKETSERTAKNPARYAKFSERIRQLIEKFQKGLIDAAQALVEAKKTAEDVVAEDKAFEDSGLSKTAYDVYKILEQYVPGGEKPLMLADSATKIEEIYRTHSEATAYWQDKPQSRKKLLQEVRRVVHSLGASDWPTLKANIDHFAVRHYGKP
jgi:type I restriction enzyme R subunit